MGTRLRCFCFIIACTAGAGMLHAQWFDWGWYTQDFDDTLRFNLRIDTADGHGGLWQIGQPQKTVFAAAHSLSNAIVTDTLQPYPPNDTSRFTITHLAQAGWSWPHTAVLEGFAWADMGPGDRGTMEISFDQGTSWLDLVNDPEIANIIQLWGGSLPPLSGSSGGWQYFNMFLSPLHEYAQSQLGITIQMEDTILYRFSFFSDSLDEPHDGLMYDDLFFQDWAESIPEYQASTFHSRVTPDPVSDQLCLIYETAGVEAPQLIVYDARGTRCLERTRIADHRATVDVSGFAPGLYSYELRSLNGKRSFGRFVKSD